LTRGVHAVVERVFSLSTCISTNSNLLTGRTDGRVSAKGDAVKWDAHLCGRLETGASFDIRHRRLNPFDAGGRAELSKPSVTAHVSAHQSVLHGFRTPSPSHQHALSPTVRRQPYPPIARGGGTVGEASSLSSTPPARDGDCCPGRARLGQT